MRLWARMSVGIALLSWLATAYAHAHLRGAVPADGSVVAAAPGRVVLEFSEAARLTAAWIRKEGGPRRMLEALPERSAARVSVPLPALGPGRYELGWRALSADGHIVPGHLHFTVSPAGASGRR